MHQRHQLLSITITVCVLIVVITVMMGILDSFEREDLIFSTSQYQVIETAQKNDILKLVRGSFMMPPDPAEEKVDKYTKEDTDLDLNVNHTSQAIRVGEIEYHVLVGSDSKLRVYGISNSMSEVHVMVDINSGSYRWRNGMLLGNYEIRNDVYNQSNEMMIPEFCESKLMAITIDVTRYFDNIKDIEAFDQNSMPKYQNTLPKTSARVTIHVETTFMKHRHPFNDENTWGYSNYHLKWLWIRDVDFNKHNCFEDQYKQRMEHLKSFNFLPKLAELDKSIVILGDSQARTTFETIVRLLCIENNPIIKEYNIPVANEKDIVTFKNIAFSPKQMCPRPTPHMNDTFCEFIPPINVTCGGLYERYGNGCWAGGYHYALPEHKIRLLYSVDLYSNSTLLFSSATSIGVTKTCPINHYFQEADIIVSFLSLHDSTYFNTSTSSRNIVNKFNEYLKVFGKKNQNGEGYKTKIIFVSIWASDPSKRSKDFHMNGSLSRAEMFFKMQNHTVQYYKKMFSSNTYFVDVFNITLGAMDQTSDGVHLYDEYPRSEIAEKVIDTILQNK